MREIVIVGNGIAGLTAGEALRNAGFDGTLRIVGDEPHPPYSRPALSKSVLLEPGHPTSHVLPAAEHGATILPGRAVGLDRERRRVLLADGTELPYDGLVIATGSRARRLATGEGAAGEFTLRGVDDALALRNALSDRPPVVVVGGGALGMEIASACLELGCAVTLAAHGQPLSRQLGGHLSALLLAAGIERGLRLAPPAAGLHHSGDATAVELADGRLLEPGVVVTAAGDLPNTGWLEDSGLLFAGRLEADSRGRIAPGIVAAGDVASIPTRRGRMRLPFWTSAIDQAKTAALGLLHGDAAPESEPQPYFWTEQFGSTLKASGFLPLGGTPGYQEPGKTGGTLMRWTHADGSGTAVALDYRMPIPRLRRFAQAGPARTGTVQAGTLEVAAARDSSGGASGP